MAPTRSRRNPEDSSDAPETTECELCGEPTSTPTTVEVQKRGRAVEEQWCSSCVDDDSNTCVSCGDAWKKKDLVVVDGDQWYCPACVEEDTHLCEKCNRRVSTAHPIIIGMGRGGTIDETWCEDCMERRAEPCGRCDKLVAHDAAISVDLSNWCPECAENCSFWCDGCHEQVSDGHDCGRGGPSGPIRAYHAASKAGFDPIRSAWTDAQPKPLFFGCEVEVEAPVNSDLGALAEQVTEELGELLAGIEEDGSLTNGFEIVTQPAGLDTHREHWAATSLQAMGLKAHDTTTCGLHVHFTRAAVSKLTLGKMLVFVNSEYNASFMDTFARRPMGTVSGYAKRVKGMKASSGLHARPDRYEALNMTNDRTVELRVAKGTTKSSTILATLEFTYALIRFAELESAQNMQFHRLLRMVAQPEWHKETRFLRAYLVDRGLASAKDMQLPKLKPGSGPGPVPSTAREMRENPGKRATRGRPLTYTDLALMEYARTGE